MCGIGFAIGKTSINSFIQNTIKKQFHRGPDFQNKLIEKFGDYKIGFSHQRLSILDLSVSGIQPMTSRSGRFTITFNGEVYNYKALKNKFRLNNLKSTTDTEVVLELIEKIGIYKASKQFNGFWALIVYDRKLGKIYISRDRFGKKPINYLYFKDGIFISSEVKSFYGLKGFQISPNKKVISRFLSQSLQNIDNNSWIEGVYSFPPSSIGTIDINHPETGIQDIRRFWSPSIKSTFEKKVELKYFEELKETLEDSIKIRLNADVPVGIALSGGVDSAIISSITHRFQSRNNLKTSLLSAINPGQKEDESYFINLQADYLKSDVNKFIFKEKNQDNFFELLKLCSYHNDGPLPSFSSLLFFKLMEYSKAIGIKVILTGQGADEAFCGYNKYPIFYIKSLFQRKRFFASLNVLLPFIYNKTLFNNVKISEAKRYLGFTNNNIFGPSLINYHEKENLSSNINLISDRQILDLKKYSVPYLCHYEDRMSMAFSREVRSPFLDYRVVELGLNMPIDLKIKLGWTKYCLRKTFENILPGEIAWRKDKMGFSNPQNLWFRKILMNKCLSAMEDNDSPVYRLGLINKNKYLKLLKKYQKGDPTIWFRDVFGAFSLNTWLLTLPD